MIFLYIFVKNTNHYNMKELLKLVVALSVLFSLSSCGLTYYLVAEAIPEAINNKKANKAKVSYDSYDYNHKKIEKPTFMGGDIKEFKDWVESHLTPLSEYNNLGGIETMEYSISPDGHVRASDDVENVSYYESQLRKELVRVINSAPQWAPGHRKGKPIYVKCKSSFVFPVSYDGMKTAPKFNGGGLNQFEKWVGSRIVYSSEIVKNKGTLGTVTVSYLIENDGRVTNVNLVKGCDPELDNQVIRIVSSSPLWSSFDISNCKKVAATINVKVRYGDEIALLKKEEEERIAQQRREEEERIARQRRAEQQRIAQQKYEEELAREAAARKALPSWAKEWTVEHEEPNFLDNLSTLKRYWHCKLNDDGTCSVRSYARARRESQNFNNTYEGRWSINSAGDLITIYGGSRTFSVFLNREYQSVSYCSWCN